MKELKNKIFYTLLAIFTLSIFSFLVAFNVRNYVKEKNNIDNNLDIAINNNKDVPRKDNDVPPKPVDDKELIDKNTKFMDYIIYTVLLDENNNIKEIINHSNNLVTDDEIRSLANNILGKTNIKNRQTGCLYFSNYSYSYSPNNALVILDNSNIKTSLSISLLISTILFLALEILFIYISKIITKWITTPVEETFEKQKTFIADASHELKTPLSVIIASSDALEENKNEKKWLNNIKYEAERMNNLITDLLELSTSENKNVYTYEINNLSKVVELSSLAFEGKAFENNIKLNLDIEKNINLKINESSIKQLIEILLDNAIKHSIKDGVITISLKDNKNYVELLVKNLGDEIPKEEEEKIFERFYRIDKARNRKENRYGLGLAIAKNIVLNHNGKITASSLNGETTFKVLLKK